MFQDLEQETVVPLLKFESLDNPEIIEVKFTPEVKREILDHIIQLRNRNFYSGIILVPNNMLGITDDEISNKKLFSLMDFEIYIYDGDRIIGCGKW